MVISPKSLEGYTSPDYATNYMDDKMETKNDKYADMVSKKDTFFSTFYGQLAAMFSGTSINDLTEGSPSSSTYAGQTTSYKASTSSSDGYSEILTSSAAVQKKRMKMDADISRLNSSRNINNKNDPGILYNAHFYVNLLWIILATTLIYYIFTEI